jgi:ribosome-associated toxin RatA of RatAB toxin-antitoxin module
MREVRRSALVTHSPAEMYALVNDVARYPEFVPWCKASQVLFASANSVTATLEIARAGLSLALTTRNEMVADERIDMALVSGPLKHFTGRWQFIAIRAPGEQGSSTVHGCRVELVVEYEFGNAALGLVLGPLFEASWDSLVDAFVRRAREVYRG